jgi:hypothetical protein
MPSTEHKPYYTALQFSCVRVIIIPPWQIIMTPTDPYEASSIGPGTLGDDGHNQENTVVPIAAADSGQRTAETSVHQIYVLILHRSFNVQRSTFNLHPKGRWNLSSALRSFTHQTDLCLMATSPLAHRPHSSFTGLTTDLTSRDTRPHPLKCTFSCSHPTADVASP